MIDEEVLKRHAERIDELYQITRKLETHSATTEEILSARKESTNFVRKSIVSFVVLIMSVFMALAGHVITSVWWAAHLKDSVDRLIEADRGQSITIRGLEDRQRDILAELRAFRNKTDEKNPRK